MNVMSVPRKFVYAAFIIRVTLIGALIVICVGTFPTLAFPTDDSPPATAESSVTPVEVTGVRQVDHVPEEKSPDAQNGEIAPPSGPSESAALPESTATPEGTASSENAVFHEGQVALTFDDGPGQFTEQLLDIFKERNIKASFFVLGRQVVEYPEIIQRMASEGHLICNHSYNHKKLGTGEASNQTIRDEIQNLDRELIDLGVPSVPYFRPPYGSYNDSVKAISDRPILLWNLDPRDWEVRDSSTIRQRVADGAVDGSIILMHDIYSTTVDAIPGILDDLAAKGMEVIPLDQLLSRNGTPPTAGTVYTYG